MNCMICNLKTELEGLKKSLLNASNEKDNTDISNKIKELSPSLTNLIDISNKIANFLIKKIQEKITSHANANIKQKANIKLQRANKKDSDNHNMQDAKKDIKWDVPKQLKIKYTNVKPLNPASYSNSEDYPLKRGFIDEKNNFETQNLVTGEWWRVHHTGYYQKVDGVGNYEEKIPGTNFHYTFGDKQISVGGNVDRVYAKNYYTYTMQVKTEDIDDNHYLNNNSNWFINTLLSHNETVGLMKNVMVGGNIYYVSGANIVIKAAGNITIEAGGVVNIKGAKINLN